MLASPPPKQSALFRAVPCEGCNGQESVLLTEGEQTRLGENCRRLFMRNPGASA